MGPAPRWAKSGQIPTKSDIVRRLPSSAIYEKGHQYNWFARKAEKVAPTHTYIVNHLSVSAVILVAKKPVSF